MICVMRAQARHRALAAGSAIALAAGAAAWAQSSSTTVRDTKGDAAGESLDLVRVSLARAKDGRLRASFGMAEAWTPADLIARSGPPGSICLRIWTESDPPDQTPDRLVCITAEKGGRKLRASVLRERPNQLPERVATASVSRPSPRSVAVRFSQTAVGRPARIDFSAETTRAGCIRVSCIDTAPNAPRVGVLQLRKPASTGGR